MATAMVHVSVQLTIEQLVAAIKQLSPDELCEFTEQFAAWQKEHNQWGEEEAALLAVVEENLRLPPPDQRRYEQLRRKCDRGTLTEDELAEYQALLKQFEARTVERIQALIALTQRRGTTVRGVRTELGL